MKDLAAQEQEIQVWSNPDLGSELIQIRFRPDPDLSESIPTGSIPTGSDPFRSESDPGGSRSALVGIWSGRIQIWTDPVRVDPDPLWS
jgi:hypothetical protein